MRSGCDRAGGREGVRGCVRRERREERGGGGGRKEGRDIITPTPSSPPHSLPPPAAIHAANGHSIIHPQSDAHIAPHIIICTLALYIYNNIIQ